ncbi:YIP1 family protein [Viridibacillus sp. NPDC096237]|uniref:YIP1 family protein n=1 Tax=Viridibacillus sp. NPDC096237 TaxID=3390721 RepID=UPI003D033DFA
MNSIDEMKEKDQIQPFFSIWLNPKKTARFVLEEKSIGYAIMFVILSGIAGTIIGTSDTEIYPIMPIWGIILLCTLLGPFLGLLSVSVSSLVVWLFGKLFGGQATYKEMFKGLSIVGIPGIWLFPFMFIWMAFSPVTYFKTDIVPGDVSFTIIAVVASIASIIIGVWSIVINVAIVSEVHRFSIWRAVLTILIPGIIFIFILIAIIGTIVGLILSI